MKKKISKLKKQIYEYLWDKEIFWRLYESLLWIPYFRKRQEKENKENFYLDIEKWKKHNPQKYNEYLEKEVERERKRKLISLQVEEKKRERKRKWK